MNNDNGAYRRRSEPNPWRLMTNLMEVQGANLPLLTKNLPDLFFVFLNLQVRHTKTSHFICYKNGVPAPTNFNLGLTLPSLSV